MNPMTLPMIEFSMSIKDLAIAAAIREQLEQRKRAADGLEIGALATEPATMGQWLLASL